MPPAVDPSQLSQDKDFASAQPEDQIKYLSAQDPEFAKAPHEDQMGYLQHLTGKSPAPNAGLAPPAGAPPKPAEAAKTMTSGEGPVARGMTSFETHLSDMAPPQAPAAAGMGSYGSAVTMAHPEMQAKMDPRGVGGLSPIVKTDTGETGGVDMGATAANLLPWVIDPAGGGIGESAAGSLTRGFGKMIPSAARAGRTLEGVKGAIGNVPVNTGPADAAATEALGQHEHGAGAIPPPIKKYIKMAGGPGGMRTFPGSTPMTFADMRDFASNAGRLSAKDMRAMSPSMKNYLNQFAKATSEANKTAAEAHGQGVPYTQGINEFRRAMKMRDFGRNAAKGAVKYGVPGAAAYYGTKEFLDRK